MGLRSFIVGLIVLFGVLVFQTTANWAALWGVKPNILLLVFIAFAIHNGCMISMLNGFILGIFVDILTGNPVGYSSFAFTLFGYIFGLGKGKIFFDPIFVPVVIAILATLGFTVIQFLLSSLFNLGKNFTNFFNMSFLISLIYNLFVSPFVYLIFNFIRDRLKNTRRGFDG